MSKKNLTSKNFFDQALAEKGSELITTELLEKIIDITSKNTGGKKINFKS